MTLVWRLARQAQLLRTRCRYRGDAPIVIVHQMARVGSVTVRRAIRQQAPRFRSFHTHYLNRDTIAEMDDRFLRLYESTGRPGVYREHLNAWWLADRLRHGRSGDWRIISLVRDPVARTVSAFFRHLSLNHPQLGPRFREDLRNVPALIAAFRDPDEPEHAFALDWFDREVRDVFGIDVYDSPFPADGRGRVYECEAGQLLVLRTEDLAKTGGETIGAFLRVGPMNLEHHNRSSDLPYAETWRRFLAELRLSPDYLERMYGSRLARHFYTPAEISAFRDRWVVD